MWSSRSEGRFSMIIGEGEVGEVWVKEVKDLRGRAV